MWYHRSRWSWTPLVSRTRWRSVAGKRIAAELVISHRAAQGDVEHILTKLGFKYRAQIAAWVVGEAEHRNSG